MGHRSVAPDTWHKREMSEMEGGVGLSHRYSEIVEFVGIPKSVCSALCRKLCITELTVRKGD